MPQVKSPTVFVYVPDANKTLDENLIEMCQHIKQTIGEEPHGPGFKVSLEIDAPSMDAKEAQELLEQAIPDAIELSKLESHSVDKDGGILYKKKVS